MTIPELKTITIVEALPDNPGHNFDFTGNYTDANGTVHSVSVFDTDYFVSNIIQLFRSRKITLPKTDPAIALKALFDSWKASRSELYFKQAYAYTLKYNPIENYSSREQMTDDITTHEHGSGTRTEYDDYKETTEITPYTKETTTETPFDKVTEEVTPYESETTTTSGISGSAAPNSETTASMMAFNSNSWVDTTKSETNVNSQEQLVKDGTEKTETTWEGNRKIELQKTGKEKHDYTITGTKDEVTHGTDTDRHQYLLTKQGNIGVMTPSEMLQKEYDGLIQDLAFRALNEFIDRYTWYSVSVD